MGPTFQLNMYIYLCLIHQQLSRVHRIVDPWERIFQAFIIFFLWREKLNLFDGAIFNASVTKEENDSHLLKDLSETLNGFISEIINDVLLCEVWILDIHSLRTHK